jgi:hypothetical protein
VIWGALEYKSTKLAWWPWRFEIDRAESPRRPAARSRSYTSGRRGLARGLDQETRRTPDGGLAKGRERTARGARRCVHARTVVPDGSAPAWRSPRLELPAPPPARAGGRHRAPEDVLGRVSCVRTRPAPAARGFGVWFIGHPSPAPWIVLHKVKPCLGAKR